jgi:hypothetical protein
MAGSWLFPNVLAWKPLLLENHDCQSWVVAAQQRRCGRSGRPASENRDIEVVVHD